MNRQYLTVLSEVRNRSATSAVVKYSRTAALAIFRSSVLGLATVITSRRCLLPLVIDDSRTHHLLFACGDTENGRVRAAIRGRQLPARYEADARHVRHRGLPGLAGRGGGRHD